MTSLKVKGKTGVEHSFSRGSSFKIYSQKENPKNEASTMKKSAVGSKAAPLTIASDSKSNLKGTLKSMIKSKGKRDSSANNIVQRKALADLSNLTSYVSTNKVYDGSKPMKNERNAFLKRVSIAPAAKTVNVLSRKPFKGKERDLLNQGATDVHTSKTEGLKNLKSCLNDRSVKTKNSDWKSVVTCSRTSKNSLLPMRKSLPVLKKEKSTEASRIMSKTKVCESASQQANSAKSHLLRNRGSDGFVTMAPKVQSNAAAHILPRPFKPIVKTALRPSHAQRTSKSKYSSGLKKPVSVAVISSEKDIELSHPENNESVISNEVSQRDLPSNDNNVASSNAPDTLAWKKSKRRRSYTSLLITRSKLLEDYGVREEEKLPGIDNDGNPLEVAEYVDEIYQYYWITEAMNPSLENYMSIQTDITPHMRGILINWLIEVHLKFDLIEETLYLMVTLLDRYLSEVRIKKSDMQLVGLTTLLLASKYEDFWHPRVKDLISISAETYTSEQMLKMEKLILKKLKFRLNAPTPHVFMLRFIKAAQSDTKFEHLAFYLIELCLVEYEALKFKPSLLCASAVYVARCTLQKTPFWTPLLCRHARYDVSEIRECAEMILRFQRAAGLGQLKVTYEKYTSHELSGVAAIKPLDRLPSAS